MYFTDSMEALDAESAALEAVEHRAEEEEPLGGNIDSEEDEEIKQQLNDYILSSKAKETELADTLQHAGSFSDDGSSGNWLARRCSWGIGVFAFKGYRAVIW